MKGRGGRGDAPRAKSDGTRERWDGWPAAAGTLSPTDGRLRQTGALTTGAARLGVCEVCVRLTTGATSTALTWGRVGLAVVLGTMSPYLGWLDSMRRVGIIWVLEAVLLPEMIARASSGETRRLGDGGRSGDGGRGC